MVFLNFFRKIKIKNILIFLLVVLILLTLFLYYYNKKNEFKQNHVKKLNQNQINHLNEHKQESLKRNIENYGNIISPTKNTTGSVIVPEKYNEHVVKMRIMKEKIKTLMSKGNIPAEIVVNVTNPLSRNIHIFYFAPVEWYKTESSTALSNKTTIVKHLFHEKKLNIHFYPYHGIYDNTNLDIIAKHFNDIKKIGIGVIVLTWTPNYPHYLLNGIFDIAMSFNLRISIQIDNYSQRTPESIRNDIKYFMDNLGLHSGLNKIYSITQKKYFPLFYIKKISAISDYDWNRILSKNGIITIRNTYYDSIVVGHISLSDHKSFIRKSNFNGFYTYLPSNGATYTSTWKNWVHLKKFADSYKLIFIPTVGPGFDEKKKQPRSGMLRRHRSGGNYYGVAWRTAISLNPIFISISSFNNWPEGSQIEQAIPKSGYKDYQPGKPNKYLELTQQFIADFIKSKEPYNKNPTCTDFINNTIC